MRNVAIDAIRSQVAADRIQVIYERDEHADEDVSLTGDSPSLPG